MSDLIDGQMSLFADGFLTNHTPSKDDKLPPIIESIVKDLQAWFREYDLKPKYEVWQHVPNLGKRLEVVVKNYPELFPVEWFNEMVKKYKAVNIELSCSVTPNFYDKTTNYYFFTMWTTPKHVENLIKMPETQNTKPKCKYTANCKTYGIGCQGTTFWCGKNGGFK